MRVGVVVLLVGLLWLSGTPATTFTGAQGDPLQVLDLRVDPEVFSPGEHGLGQLTLIAYNLSQDANVTIEVRDAQGTVLDHVIEDLPVEAGGDERPWSGIADGDYVPDGEYTIRVVAQDDQGGADQDEARVVVDTTPPDLLEVDSLSVQKDEADHVVVVTGGSGTADPGTARVAVYDDIDLDEALGHAEVADNGSFVIDLEDDPLERAWLVPEDLPGNPGPAVTVPALVRGPTPDHPVISPYWTSGYNDGTDVDFHLDSDAELTVDVYRETRQGTEFFLRLVDAHPFDAGNRSIHWNTVDHYNDQGEDAPDGRYRLVFEAVDEEGHPSPRSQATVDLERTIRIEDDEGEPVKGPWDAGTGQSLSARMYSRHDPPELIGSVEVAWAAEPHGFGEPTPATGQATDFGVQQGPGEVHAVHDTGAWNTTGPIEVLPSEIARVGWLEAPQGTDADTNVTFLAQAQDEYGNPREDPVAYTLDAGSGVVHPATGLFEPQATGMVVVNATAEGFFNTTRIEVAPGGLQHVDLVGPDPVVAGTSLTFSIEGSDSKGNAVPMDPGSFVHVVPMEPGPHKVVHTVQGITANRTVTVLEHWDGLVGLRVDPQVAHVPVGAEQSFTARGRPVGGALEPVNATWHVEPGAAGTVTPNGTLELEPGWTGVAHVTAEKGPLEHHVAVHVTMEDLEVGEEHESHLEVVSNTDRGSAKIAHNTGFARVEAGAQVSLEGSGPVAGEAVIRRASLVLGDEAQDLGLLWETRTADPDDLPEELDSEVFEDLDGALRTQGFGEPLLFLGIAATEHGEPTNGSRLNALVESLELEIHIDPAVFDADRFDPEKVRLVKQGDEGLVRVNATLLTGQTNHTYVVELDTFSVYAVGAGLRPQAGGGGGGGGGGDQDPDDDGLEDDAARADEEGDGSQDTDGRGDGQDNGDTTGTAMEQSADVEAGTDQSHAWMVLLVAMGAVLVAAGVFYLTQRRP